MTLITSTHSEIDRFLQALGWMISREQRFGGRVALGDMLCFSRPGRNSIAEGGIEGRDYFWSHLSRRSLDT